MAAIRCDANDAKDALKFFADGIGCGLAVSSPPGFELADVLGCQPTDLDR
jgi:hypothetical protein